jgi:glycosyltransferase involved in cell wall biosynthesis
MKKSVKPVVLFLSKGESSASTRYRALQYFPLLQTAGWSPRHRNMNVGLWQRLTLLGEARQADVVVVLRKTFAGWYLWLLRRAARRLVFDFDDAIFVRSNGEPSRLRLNRFRRMMRQCDQVWAGNGYLARQAGRYNRSVLQLPTALDVSKYPISVNKPADSIDLVWIGSRATRKYLETILPVLERLAQQQPDLRLKIIANFDLDTVHLNTLPVQWQEATEATELASSHIGIAPMLENDWTRGKCALKVLQYMAAGLPVVASPAGINRDIVTDNVTGYLASNDEQWQQCLLQLIENPDLRAQLGSAGRQQVADFDLQPTAGRMLQSLDELLQRR